MPFVVVVVVVVFYEKMYHLLETFITSLLTFFGIFVCFCFCFVIVLSHVSTKIFVTCSSCLWFCDANCFLLIVRFANDIDANPILGILLVGLALFCYTLGILSYSCLVGLPSGPYE